jgi:hypothetical protein
MWAALLDCYECRGYWCDNTGDGARV